MKSFILYFTSAALGLWSCVVLAQNFQQNPMTLEGQGSLVVLRMELANKKAKLFIVGKKSAELDLSKDAKVLQITAFHHSGKKEELQFSPDTGFYSITKLPNWSEPFSLQVKTQVKDQVEQIKLNVRP